MSLLLYDPDDNEDDDESDPEDATPHNTRATLRRHLQEPQGADDDLSDGHVTLETRRRRLLGATGQTAENVVPLGQQARQNTVAFAPPVEAPVATGDEQMSAITSTIKQSQYNVADMLPHDLAWQKEVAGESAKLKAFRQEAMQQQGLVVFAYMKPNSPFVHYLHSAATFFAPGGVADLRAKEIGFLGDKMPFQTPTPIILTTQQPWKWVRKKIVHDPVALELFYALAQNVSSLWHPAMRDGEIDMHMPRLLFLPTPFVAFVVE